MDPLTLFVGGGLFAVGVLIGRAMRVKPPKDPGPVCTCGHGYGQHEQAKKCHGEEMRSRYSAGSWTGYEYAPCPCLSYDGPEPLPKVWTPGGGL